MTVGKVQGEAEFWREDGHWCFILRAPYWVMVDMYGEVAKGRLRVANFGGTTPLRDDLRASMLIQVMPGSDQP